MLPPILEIYVVWHPDDGDGPKVAKDLMDHFHGSRFTGLIGGAVEVFVRHEGWLSGDAAPRPIPLPSSPPPFGLTRAQLTVVVPVIGLGFARAVQDGSGPWFTYARELAAASVAAPDEVALFPVTAERDLVAGTVLERLFGNIQQIYLKSQQWTRSLVQAVAQFAGGISTGRRLKVFISYTAFSTPHEGDRAHTLLSRVRSVIDESRLAEFFAPRELQPGSDWSKELEANASTGAVLALRTDLYATRTWCQKEILVAKRSGMPVVVLDALLHGEERGSFLMDHVPRVPVRWDEAGWREPDIHRGLSVLVDECLQRALWRRQEETADELAAIKVAWWAPHAPEPTTLVHWFAQQSAVGGAGIPVRVLHPDPPLGPDELEVLDQMAAVSGLPDGLDVLTPRTLAARGGG